jgi:hypothetical protein
MVRSRARISTIYPQAVNELWTGQQQRRLRQRVVPVTDPARRLAVSLVGVAHFDMAIIGTGSGNSLVTPDFDGKRVAIIESGTFAAPASSGKDYRVNGRNTTALLGHAPSPVPTGGR